MNSSDSWIDPVLVLAGGSCPTSARGRGWPSTDREQATRAPGGPLALGAGAVLRVLSPPAQSRAQAIGTFYADPVLRPLAELMIDLEESPVVRAVLVAELGELQLGDDAEAPERRGRDPPATRAEPVIGLSLDRRASSE
jgi:hypothetical protein